MKRLVTMLMAVVAVTVCGSMAEARNSMLESVNTTCGTSYSCGLCHIDPKGGGPLTPEGDGYLASGKNSCYFCSTAPACGGSACTDADADNYFAESACGTSVDCNDNNAAINPGAIEACTGGIDNDCDGKIDCADSNCTASPSCTTTAEVCNDAVDNDGDGKADCADRDCRNDPACKTTISLENTRKLCGDNKDNDGDGLQDCADTDCAAYCK